MTEFRKLEGESLDIYNTICADDGLMPHDVLSLRQRFDGAIKCLEKYKVRRDEVDHVTDKDFLILIAETSDAVDKATMKYNMHLEEQLKASLVKKENEQVEGGGDISDEDLKQSLFREQQEAQLALNRLELERPQHVVTVPRYGASMIARINAVEELHSKISTEFPKVESKAEERGAAAQLRQQHEQQAEERKAREEEEKKLKEEEALKQQALALEEAKQAEQDKEEKKKEKKRAAEAAALEVQLEAEEYSKQWPKGEEGVRQAVEQLRNRAELSEVQTALGGLAAILSGLINHPDDEKRRTIKVNNEKFHADIGRLGCEVLFAAGFKLKHFKCEGEYTEDGLNKYEAMLTLREPDPFNELDLWTKWFDNLKVCSTITSTLAAEVGAKEIKPLEAAPKWANSSKGY